VYILLVGFKNDSEKALGQAREELLRMFKEQEELQISIAKQHRRVAALATLVDDSEEADTIMGLELYGLKDAIGIALKSAMPNGLTASEIMGRLIQLCFPVNEYTNFRASLNSVLKRFVQAGEVRVAMHDVDAKSRRDESVYQWVGKPAFKRSSFKGPGTYVEF
jgi:hypothetical protein